MKITLLTLLFEKTGIFDNTAISTLEMVIRGREEKRSEELTASDLVAAVGLDVADAVALEGRVQTDLSFGTVAEERVLLAVNLAARDFLCLDRGVYASAETQRSSRNRQQLLV